MDNIILIGFMGSGKSTVGRLLAKNLGAKFIDLDEVIEKEEGKSITEIFETEGEGYFRKLESKAVMNLKGLSSTVVACGGGVIKSEDNVKKLKELGKIVYLAADLDVLVERATMSPTRPLLRGADPMERARGIFEARRSLYEAAADLIVDTSSLTPSEAAMIIEVNL